jgi:ABC-type uncharacterized transport system auxiliary subunit
MEAPPLATFDLPSAAPQHETTRRAEIRVRSPKVAEALDSYRLIARSENGGYTPLGAQWSDRLPDLIAQRAVDSLSAAGLHAFGEGGPATANYDLMLEVDAFDYDAGEQRVEIAIAAKVVALTSGRTLARQEFAATEPVQSGDPSLVAAALAKTFSGVMADVASFVADKV